MALINCPECNKQISDKANICVGCGAPVVIDSPQ
jgi:predicted amidophosphoribosyltransferase